MRLPHLTVRRLMLLVAVLAMLLGFTAWMKRRQADFAWESQRHRDRFYWFRAQEMVGKANASKDDGWLRSRDALGTYHDELAKKYERAEKYPWLPIAGDPPEPPDTPEPK